MVGEMDGEIVVSMVGSIAWPVVHERLLHGYDQRLM